MQTTVRSKRPGTHVARIIRQKRRTEPPAAFSRTRAIVQAIAFALLLGNGSLHAETTGSILDLVTVETGINSYRLLAMSMDADGCIWAGSIHHVLHRFDPRTGKVENIPLPAGGNVSSCICVGDKVYLLGQAYPKLLVYQRKTAEFREHAYPSPRADVWYGTDSPDGRHIYLFDRAVSGVIKWDTHSETGTVIPYPFASPLPSSGRFAIDDHALWCASWDFTTGQYIPVGIARLDMTTDQFTSWHPFPEDDTDLAEFTNAQTTFFYPETLQGKLRPFDWQTRRWAKAIVVPRFHELFSFIGLATVHRGRWIFSLSTYNGTELGCDGKPYHFCNGLLEFDPVARTFAFPQLQSEGRYYQVAYTLSARDHFFATGSNIREADGSLNQARAGEVVFWQTLRPR
jgi:streptogramin lyase